MATTDQDYHAPTAQTAVIVHIAPRWIAVSERLPIVHPTTRSDDVLVIAVNVDGSRFQTTGILSDVRGRQRWLIRGSGSSVTVTHWQPLPPLPDEADGAVTLDAILERAATQPHRGKE